MKNSGPRLIRFFSPVFRGPPADPFGERVRKNEGVLVTHLLRNTLDGLGGSDQQLGGVPHPEIRHLVHGTPPHLALAQPAQMFIAVTRLPRQPRQRPFLPQIGGHPLPNKRN